VSKHRLTNDLSWPKPCSMPDGKGGFVESVNGAMLRDDWPYNRLMRVHEVAEAAPPQGLRLNVHTQLSG
jgi:hypothetical protein